MKATYFNYSLFTVFDTTVLKAKKSYICLDSNTNIEYKSNNHLITYAKCLTSSYKKLRDDLKKNLKDSNVDKNLILIGKYNKHTQNALNNKEVVSIILDATWLWSYMLPSDNKVAVENYFHEIYSTPHFLTTG